MKFKIFAIMFICVAAKPVQAEDPTALSAADIIKESQAKYASLTSYSDEGTAVAILGQNAAANYNFNIRLARTNLYQIVWRQDDAMFKPMGAVWSTGDGDYLWMAMGSAVKKCQNREMAIASATG